MSLSVCSLVTSHSLVRVLYDFFYCWLDGERVAVSGVVVDSGSSITTTSLDVRCRFRS